MSCLPCQVLVRLRLKPDSSLLRSSYTSTLMRSHVTHALLKSSKNLTDAGRQQAHQPQTTAPQMPPDRFEKPLGLRMRGVVAEAIESGTSLSFACYKETSKETGK